MSTSVAHQVLRKIKNTNSPNFTSRYTTAAKRGSIGIMTVDETGLFEDMTHEEKLDLAFIDEYTNRPFLNIWLLSWVYVEETDDWILIGRTNAWNAELSYQPLFVKYGNEEDSYVLDTTTGELFGLVTQPESES